MKLETAIQNLRSVIKRKHLPGLLQDRKLWLFFETIQMEQIVRDCIMEAVSEIATKTEIVPMLGSAN